MNDEIYIGSTDDLKRRVEEHNNGREPSTRRYIPWKVLYYEAYEKENFARLREKKLKHHGNALRELKKRIGLIEKNKRGAGFTLTESLIVIAIIAILSVLVFPYYHPARKQLALQRSANQLAQDVRRAQGMALAAEEVGPSGAKIIPEGGYGIYFKSTPQEIIIFVDCNSNSHFDPGNVCGEPPNKFSEEIENIGNNLESGVQISGLLPSSPLEIIFRPPDPVVVINGGEDNATITLISINGQTKSIKVNKAGLIYVE